MSTLAEERDALVDQILTDARRQVDSLLRLTSQLSDEVNKEEPKNHGG